MRERVKKKKKVTITKGSSEQKCIDQNNKDWDTNPNENWITVTRKSDKHLCTTQKHWTAVSTLLGLISSVYRDLHHWKSNERPQIAESKLYNWANSLYRTQVMPN